jgi:hypothetical protein
MCSVNKMMQLHKKQMVVLAGKCCICWLVVAGNAVAQNAKPPETYVSIGNTCESNIARLDKIHSEAGDSGLVIAIARLGEGEQTHRLNQRRLHNARLYLEKVRGRAPKTIITAESDQVRGRGRIEIYVQGKLVDVLGVGRREDLYAGSCDGTGVLDRYFYDARRRKSRRQ